VRAAARRARFRRRRTLERPTVRGEGDLEVRDLTPVGNAPESIKADSSSSRPSFTTACGRREIEKRNWPHSVSNTPATIAPRPVVRRLSGTSSTVPRREVADSPHRPPLQATGLLASAVLVVRFLYALRVRTPVLFPDEYIHTALARAIVDGTFPHVRGGSVNFLSYLAPLLMAPGWLISKRRGCLSDWKAPRFCSVRRLRVPRLRPSRDGSGFTGYGATFGALLVVLVPDGVYTRNLIAEPYAYVAMLLATLIAVDAIARPVRWRQAVVIVACGVLVFLAGAQMVVYWGCVSTRIVVLPAGGRSAPTARPSASWWGGDRRRGRWRSGSTVALQPGGRLGQVWGTASTSFHLSRRPECRVVRSQSFRGGAGGGLGRGAGCVLGLRSLTGSNEPNRRAFGWLTAILVFGLLVEAVPFGVNADKVLERYAFYAAPLLGICFVHAWQRGTAQNTGTRRSCMCRCRGGAAASGQWPASSEQCGRAPSVLGLTQWGWDKANIWGPALAVVAAAFAWRSLGRWIAPAAIVICVVLSALISHYVALGSERASKRRAFLISGRRW